MKCLLAYVFIVLGLGLMVNVNAKEIKFDRLKINTNDQNFRKIGGIIGFVEGYKYINNFYANVENNKLKGFIETFTWSIEYESRMYSWTKDLISSKDSGRGCDESNKNLYFKKNNFSSKLLNCLKIHKIKNTELSSPNFNFAIYISMRKRDHAIKKFINKKKIIVPSEMLRAEHFFYKNGKLIWVFFSSNIDLNSQQNIDQFINQTIQEHKNYEKQLGRREINSIVFKDIDISQKNLKKTPKVTNLKKKPINQLKDINISQKNSIKTPKVTNLKKKPINQVKDKEKIETIANDNVLIKELNDLKKLYKSGVLTEDKSLLLQRGYQLYKSGVLTEDEYKKAKNRILN